MITALLVACIALALAAGLARRERAADGRRPDRRPRELAVEELR